jgi:hypothetical protein
MLYVIILPVVFVYGLETSSVTLSSNIDGGCLRIGC